MDVYCSILGDLSYSTGVLFIVCISLKPPPFTDMILRRISTSAKHIPTYCRAKDSKRHAFALVIALLLMAFAVVLITSLSALVTLSIQSTNTSTTQRQAEQSALFALNVALGKLQQMASDDQRVTARADIVSEEAPYWTGVWSTDPDDANFAPASDATLADIKNRPAIEWIVSEPNDGTDTLLQTFGEKTTANMTENEVLLATQGKSGSPVILSKQPLENNNNAIVGNYAYWVSDEGIKASIALEPENETERNSNLSARNPSRMGIEAITEIGDLLPDPSLEESIFRESLLGLSRSASLQGTTNVLDTTDQLIKDYQHDLTYLAYGLPTNVRDGGLKKDLTAAFEKTNEWTKLISHHGSNQLFEPINPNLTGNNKHRDPGGPRWEQLRSYYELRPNDDETITPIASSDTQSGIYPVITHFSLHQHMVMYQDGLNQLRPRLLVYPVLVLWNPYSKPIEASEYLLKVSRNQDGKMNLDMKPRIYIDPDSLSDAEKSSAVSYNANSTDQQDGAQLLYQDHYSTGVRSYFRQLAEPFNYCTNDTHLIFSIDSLQIEPGDALIFAVGSSIKDLPNNLEEPIPLANKFDAEYYYYTDHSNTLIYNNTTESISEFAFETDSTAFVSLQLAVNNPSNNDIYSGFNIGDVLQFVSGGSFHVGSNRTAISWGVDDSYIVAKGDFNDGLLPGDAALGNSLSFPAMNGYMHLKMVDNMGAKDNKQDHPSDTEYPASYIRPVANANPRAVRSGRSPSEQARTYKDMSFNPNYFNASPYYKDWTLTTAEDESDYESLLIYFDYETDSTDLNIGFSDTQTNKAFSSGWVLFDISTDQSSIFSIADLTHANLSQPASNPAQDYKNPTKFFNINNTWPAYPIGNSLLDPRIPQEKISQDSWPDSTVPGKSNPTTEGYQHYDVSYLLNDALWDDYFFSAYNETITESYNERYQLNQNFALGFDESAENIVTKGAFNINSTSVEAWKVFLSSQIGAQVEYSNETESFTVADLAPLLRVTNPVNGATPNDCNALTEEVYNGFITLSESDIKRLAEAIVQQVKKRGPFISLSHFINRVITSPENLSTKEADYLAETVEENGISGEKAMMTGPLQAAIDASGVNQFDEDGNDRFNDDEFQNKEEDLDEFYDFLQIAPSVGDRAAGNPGCLTQLDLLKVIGPPIQARSDTFMIRAYGESVDPLTGDAIASAICSATVTRTIDENAPATDRKFIISSFQWLDEDQL